MIMKKQQFLSNYHEIEQKFLSNNHEIQQRYSSNNYKIQQQFFVKQSWNKILFHDHLTKILIYKDF